MQQINAERDNLASKRNRLTTVSLFGCKLVRKGKNNCVHYLHCVRFAVLYVHRKEGANMLEMSATTVRKEWSAVVDSVVREKPIVVKRTRDRMFLASIAFLT